MKNFHYQNPKLLFHGKRIDVLSVEVPHSGRMIEREVVSHPGAVVILPFLDDQTILLIRNERYVVGRELWELPAGTLEKGEEPLACATRELEEETGFQATRPLKPLLSFFSAPGFCNEILYVFTATDLRKTSQKLDETEKITVEIVPFASALKMIKEGTICDAKTICSILFYAKLK